MAETLNGWLVKFWDWVDTRNVIRRIIVIVTWAVTIDLIYRCWGWAATTTKTGTDVAAVIAAFMTPLSILQGFVSKFYFDSRGDTK
jgi:uncharacterized oligopeptide transporter (OPT) family protein